MDYLESIMISLGICVALPVMIVWLVTRTRQNETNKKTEVMLKAIESGVSIDPEFYKAQQKQKGLKTIKERLLRKLTSGCIFTLMGAAHIAVAFINRDMMSEIHMSPENFTMPCLVGGIFLAIGLALMIAFFVGRKMLAREMEAEVKEMEQK